MRPKAANLRNKMKRRGRAVLGQGEMAVI